MEPALKSQKELDSEIFESIYQVSKSLKEQMTDFSQTCEITLLQYMALSFIEKNGSVHMKEIADHFRIEMPTATSLLNKLAKQSLVKRTSDKIDRRVVRVSLNKKGEEILQNAKKIQAANIKKMLSYLTDTQKENMRDILSVFLNKINEK